MTDVMGRVCGEFPEGCVLHRVEGGEGPGKEGDSVVWANKAARGLLGGGEEDLFGKSVTAILPGEQGGAWASLLSGLSRGETRAFRMSPPAGVPEAECKIFSPREGYAVTLFSSAPGGRAAFLPYECERAKECCDVFVQYSYDWVEWGDETGRAVLVSPACARISGYTAEEFLADPNLFESILPEKDVLAWRACRKSLLGERKEANLCLRVRHKEGGEVWIEHNATPVFAEDGRYIGYRVNNHEVTGDRSTMLALQKSEEQYRLLFENSTEAIVILQGDAVVMCNRVACRLTGYDVAEMRGASYLSFVHPEDREEIGEAAAKRQRGEIDHNKQRFRVVREDGIVRHVESGGIGIKWNDQNAAMVFISDVTDREEMEDELRRSEEKYRMLTEFTSDVIWIYNTDRQKYTYISPMVTQLRGVTPEEAYEESLEDTMTHSSFEKINRHLKETRQEFLRNPESQTAYINEVQNKCKNGTLVWVEISTKYRFNSKGEVEVVGVSRNIEERKNAERKILYLSYFDQLTGLYNRRYYEEELRRIDTEDSLPLTLVMADVNGLKLTNDAFGHNEGDRLLKTVADILRQYTRNRDVVARTGGDEFVLLLPKTAEEEAGKIVKAIQQEIAARASEHVILSVSIGYSTKSRAQDRMEEVFVEAEDIMYRKKLAESNKIKRETINLIAKRLQRKSRHEHLHSEHVSKYAEKIGEALGLTQGEVKELGLVGMLHDIGKINISDSLLGKTGDISPMEWQEIRKHPEIGYQILRSVNEFAQIAEYVLCHHERVDGNGYPRGLKGDQIPLFARIVSVADVYDALISEQPYRKANVVGEAVERLRECAGKQLDPDIVEVFVKKVLKYGENKHPAQVGEDGTRG